MSCREGMAGYADVGEGGKWAAAATPTAQLQQLHCIVRHGVFVFLLKGREKTSSN